LTRVSTFTIAATERFLFARTVDRVVGSMGVVPQPHGLGLVFPPDVESIGATVEIRRLLIRAAVQRLQQSGCRFAQLVLPDEQRGLADPFVESGFVPLTDAITFEHDRGPSRRSEAVGLAAETCNPQSDTGFLVKLVGRINQGSLDCPELDAYRTAAEVVSGHIAAASLGQSEWLIYHSAADPIGTAIWMDCPADDVCELLFFGVVPEFRGNGFGGAILNDVLLRCAPIRPRIRAAVDSRNHYAINCYSSAQFEPTARAGIWIHSLGRTS